MTVDLKIPNLTYKSNFDFLNQQPFFAILCKMSIKTIINTLHKQIFIINIWVQNKILISVFIKGDKFFKPAIYSFQNFNTGNPCTVSEELIISEQNFVMVAILFQGMT